jgi:hypothetical protein
MKTKTLITVLLSLICVSSFAAISEKEKQEIRHLLELKVPKTYIMVLKGERKIRDLLDGPELSRSQKIELKEFIDSQVPRNIIPLLRGDKNLEQLGLKDYYLSAVEEAKYKSQITQN